MLHISSSSDSEQETDSKKKNPELVHLGGFRWKIGTKSQNYLSYNSALQLVEFNGTLTFY